MAYPDFRKKEFSIMTFVKMLWLIISILLVKMTLAVGSFVEKHDIFHYFLSY